MRRLTQPCTLNCTGPQCSRRATGPHGPHIGVLGLRFTKNDTLLKDGKGRKLRAGWHGGVKETSKETSSVRAPVYLEFTTRTVCLGGCGHKEVGCRGRRAPVGAARAALGGSGRASLARPPWRWRANHARLELLLRLHATHLAVMGKSEAAGQQSGRCQGFQATA